MAGATGWPGDRRGRTAGGHRIGGGLTQRLNSITAYAGDTQEGGHQPLGLGTARAPLQSCPAPTLGVTAAVGLLPRSPPCHPALSTLHPVLSCALVLRWGPQPLAQCSSGEESASQGMAVTHPPPQAGSRSPCGDRAGPRHWHRHPQHSLSKHSHRQRRGGSSSRPARAPLGKHSGWELISHGHPSVCSLMSPTIARLPGTAQRGPAWPGVT